MAPQVGRIAIVVLAVVGIFVGVRSQLVPAGFGSQGFHRTQGPESIAKSPLRHAGIDACMNCHGDKADTTPHVKKGVRCESCHRAAASHAENWESVKPYVPSSRADCTRCHAKIVSRPAWYPQIDPKTHNPDSKCNSCHLAHEAPQEDAQ